MPPVLPLALSLDDAKRETEDFLTVQIPDVLAAVDYDAPSFAEAAVRRSLADLTRAEVETRHVPGTSDAAYRIRAFGDELLMRLQLNVRRFVLVYLVPVREPIDSHTIAPHFERWAIGAGHAGWLIGWRDAVDAHAPDHRWVETYCYANLEPDFLTSDLHKLYWRTDILQMTRAFMLEAHRAHIPLSPTAAGYRI